MNLKIRANKLSTSKLIINYTPFTNSIIPTSSFSLPGFHSQLACFSWPAVLAENKSHQLF